MLPFLRLLCLFLPEIELETCLDEFFSLFQLLHVVDLFEEGWRRWTEIENPGIVLNADLKMVL